MLAGDQTVNHVARWDGFAWQGLGSGMTEGIWPGVSALASLGGDLIAGGGFEISGGTPCDYIARWDGLSWSPLGAGLNAPVRSLTTIGTELFVGGEFTEAGGNPAPHIARWGGSVWSSLDTGTSNWVDAICAYQGYLYAAGWFTRAGFQPSYYLGRWDGQLPSGCIDLPCEPEPRISGLSLRVSGGNPVHGGIRLDVFLPQPAPVRLGAYDVQGRLLGRLWSDTLPSGWHSIPWRPDATGEARLAPGACFLRLESLGRTRTCRVVVVR